MRNFREIEQIMKELLKLYGKEERNETNRKLIRGKMSGALFALGALHDPYIIVTKPKTIFEDNPDLFVHGEEVDTAKFSAELSQYLKDREKDIDKWAIQYRHYMRDYHNGFAEAVKTIRAKIEPK